MSPVCSSPPLAKVGIVENVPSVDLLESSHVFPGPYKIKAIGPSDGDFARRVRDAALVEIGDSSKIDESARNTPGGRHVSVTLDFEAKDADQVRAVYARIRAIEGLILLL